MSQTTPSHQVLIAEVAELRARLEDAEEMLRAIRAGEVDALVVEGDVGPRLFTLQGLDAEQNRMRGEMLASVSDAVIAVDIDDHITFLNAAAERQYGVRASDVLGRSLSEAYTPLWPDPAKDAGLRTALDERGEWRGELVHRTRDGRELPVEMTVAALRGADGTSAGVISAIRDVSARRVADEALRTSEAFNRSLMDGSTDCIKVLDVDGRLVHMNAPGLCVMEIDDFGPLCGQEWSALWPAGARQDIERSLATAGSGGSYAFQAFCPTAKGTPRWWDVVVSPVRDEVTGQVVRLLSVSRDITARKVAEEQVTRLAAIVESSHDALFSEDLDGIITSWNRGAEHIFGFRADEIVGTSIMRLIPEALQAEEHERQGALVAGEHGGTFETTRQAKDGRQFPASITISPLKDAAGTVIGSSRVVRDVSERQRVEQVMRQNAELFASLIAQAPMGTYVVDAQFRMRQTNAEAMPVFASVQPLEGRDFGEVLDILWGPDVGGRIAGVFRHTLETGERHLSPPFTERRQDIGIEQSYEWQTQRITLPDGQFGVVCYFHDVTERTEAAAALEASAERLSLASEATGIGVWEWHLRSNRIKWDAQMFRLYGVPPTADGYVEYGDWSGAVVPEDLVVNEASLQETVRRRGRNRRTFRIYRRDDGECRHIEAVEIVWINAAGAAERVLGTNLDVTAREHADLDLRRLAADLVEADRRKDAFLATLSHELRNPLAAIRTGIHLLTGTTHDRLKAEQNYQRMARQVAMLVRLLDDLMDVSRISRDKLTLRTQRLDLVSIVHGAIETCQPILESEGRAVTVTLPPQLVAVNGDATRLVQVVSNLVTNAAKYSDRGSPIDLTVEVHGHLAELRLRDRGIGIAPGDLPRIFEMFAQIDAARDRAHGGLGIGLHLVKRLVEMHGGSVEAHSEGLGHGTEFVVRLPLASALPERTSAGEHQGASPPQPRRLRVLVADDNLDAASTLAELLMQLGHEVRTAHNGAQAVTLAATTNPDVALLDLGMPELRGDEAGRRIRAQPGGDRVMLIAVTGWGQDEDRERSHAAGFDYHLVKPVDPAALAALLASRTPGSPSHDRSSESPNRSPRGNPEPQR